MNDKFNYENYIIIDGSVIKAKAEFYSALKKQFDPEFIMGSNLDAFHDVLTSISVPTLIVLKNKSQLADHLGSYWDIAYQVIMDSMEENCCLGISLQD